MADYVQSAINYVTRNRIEILRTANVLGISAGAIAGSMAEENHSYETKPLNNVPSDRSLIHIG